MHLGELGTPYVSVVTLGVPGQLMGSIHPSANCGWACRKLTLHSFEHSGILGKAIKPQPGIWKGWAEVLSLLCWVFGTLKQMGSQLPIEDPGGSL